MIEPVVVMKGTSADGGYDSGYSACPMFWPDRPGSLLLELEAAGLLVGGRALDLGCGEGTNAAWLEQRGYRVDAIELSQIALDHARAKYSDSRVEWIHGDAASFEARENSFDLVVAYGLLHCLREPDVIAMLRSFGRWTAAGGHLVMVCFNDRSHDLRAHPGFAPTLLPHTFYRDALSDWELTHCSDRDLFETHPNNNIPHHHSMTRITARRLS